MNTESTKINCEEKTGVRRDHFNRVYIYKYHAIEISMLCSSEGMRQLMPRRR